MTRAVVRVVGPVIVGLAVWSGVAVAQSNVAARETAPAMDTRAADAVLERQVSVDLSRASIRHAVDVVAGLANARVFYKSEIFAGYATPVSLHAVNVPLHRLFADILAGTRLHVVPVANGALSIEERDTREGTQQSGITGVVWNVKNKQPIDGAVVWLDDSTHVSRTDVHGRYHFPSVTTGAHHVLVRAVGYGRQVRAVTIGDGQSVTVDFALEASVNTLDQVVVTATGEQRIRELGHVVSQIKADSLVKEAPVTNVIDLLQSRVPGLQVLTTSGGIAGGPSSLRLRGQSSLSLNSEPIVVVDGVRYKSTTEVPSGAADQPDYRGFIGVEPPNPLSDLNVNDIETVEVVKGPSASTLYGPDAANGVIVITTKRGKPGAAQWNWYAHPLTNDVPDNAQRPRSAIKVWAHAYNDTVTRAQVPYTCTLQAQYDYHQCVIDSVTSAPSVLQEPGITTIGPSKPTWQYGANVSGGSPAFRYYFSGDYTNQIGNVQVPTIVQELLKQQLGVSSLSDAIRTPSTYQTIGTRASVSASPSPILDLTGSVDYHQTSQRVYSPGLALSIGNIMSLPPGATGQLGDSLTDQFILSNVYNLQWAMLSQQGQGQRTVGSIQATYRPRPWLTGNALVGLDLDAETEHDLQPSVDGQDDGAAQDFRRNSIGRTVTLGATAINALGALSFRSSAGVNYVYTHLDGLNTDGYSMPAGSNSIGTAGYVAVQPLWTEQVSLGTYLQEVIGVANQLFLDGGVRYDGSTRFGDGYHPAALPKIGLSWIASDAPGLRGRLPGLSDLRFRASLGASTRYPTASMKIGQLGGYQANLFGGQYTAYSVGVLANPLLRPETSREFEYGADATVLSRMQFGLSWYHRTTRDELLDVPLPTGVPSTWINIASVGQHGFEATATLPLVATMFVQSDLQLGYSHQVNKVLSLGATVSGTAQGFTPGLPLDAVTGTPVLSVNDKNGDGVFEYGEEVLGSKARYYGVSEPPTTVTLTPTVRFLNSRVRLAAVFDRETGFVVYNQTAAFCSLDLTCAAAYLKSTPILVQAQLWSLYSNNPAFLQSGDFTRWREFNVTLDVPTQWLRLDVLHLAFSRASFSLQGRNLILWTPLKNADPESQMDAGQYGPTRGGLPQTRSWGFRFDITP